MFPDLSLTDVLSVPCHVQPAGREGTYIPTYGVLVVELFLCVGFGVLTVGFGVLTTGAGVLVGVGCAVSLGTLFV